MLRKAFAAASAAGLLTLGATLVTLKAPDRRGDVEPLTLYLDTLADYLRGHPLFGSVVGRYANRIAFGTSGIRLFK